MQARASASEVNHEAFNSSCRSLALNDSMQAFCCGFPGVRDAVVGRLVQSAQGLWRNRLRPPGGVRSDLLP